MLAVTNGSPHYLVNRSELARLYRVTVTAVGHWFNRGLTRQEDGRIDLSDAIPFREQLWQKEMDRRGSSSALEEYRRAKADREQITLARELDDTVDRAYLEDAVAKLSETIRDNSRNLVHELIAKLGLNAEQAKLATEARAAFLERCAAVMNEYCATQADPKEPPPD